MDKPNLGKTLLSYMLYYVDFNYYELYGRSITNETYKKDKRGLIIPIHFNEIINELVECGVIYTRKEDYYCRRINRYYVTRFLDLEFSYLEYHIMEDVIRKFSNFNSQKIVEYTCNDVPYKVAEFGSNIEYFYTKYRDETSINYLKYDFFYIR